MAITSRANPLVKKIASLSDKKFRREYGEYVVEGTKPVKECIKAGCEITAIVCTPETEKEFENAIVVSEEVFKHLSSEKTPQGALATVKIPITSVVPPKGNCLLLDRLQDPGNLGTIIRTANAAGYEDIYLLNCTDAFSPKAVRASMSGIFFIRLHIVSSDELFSALDNIPLICADMGGEDVFTVNSPEGFCLCIGNEGRGVSEEVKNKCTYTIGIPMRKTCESLNAAISAAIAMYTLEYRK